MSRGLCGACGEWFDDATPCKCGEYWQRVRIDPKTRALSVAPVVTATIQLAVDPRKALSEQEVLTRVQAMGEESLSPDNFEGLMRALEALKTTRNVDGDSEDPGAKLAALREQVKLLRDALEGARIFIVDGLEFWCVEQPEPGKQAFDALNGIYRALAQTKPKEVE